MPGPADWERLSAFADGELAVAEQREVATLLSASPQASETLRGIVRLKEQLRALPAADAPPPPRIAIEPTRRLRPRSLVAVTAAAALLLVAGVALLAVRPIGSPQPDPFLAASLAAHERHADAVPTEGVIPVAADPIASELARLGLRPAWRSVAAGGEEHAGFTGTRGCRLSLHVTTRTQPERPAGAGDPPHALARWNAAGKSYLLIATGMPPARFAIMAGFLRDLTSRPGPGIEPLRTALRQDWSTAPSCVV
ncbi:hypothetical protein [Bosea sp. (in: a-proteobacteria)]|uniref:hypothetical protein n=1 Tax=Bosea sp. (in: a-proteobacteria) TaxID=1871050 RepID=UPI002FCB20CC